MGASPAELGDRASLELSAQALPTDASSESAITVLIALAANVMIALTKSFTAVLTGSPAMGAEAAHSWADSGNEVLLMVAQRRSRRSADKRHPGGFGREAYVWSLIAAFGLFAAGAAVAVIRGVQELLHPEAAQHFWLAYLVLLIAFVLEGVSFVQSWRQGRREARQADRLLLEHILATSDPTLRAVFAEDAAALVGLMVAAGALFTRQLTGSPIPDAIGSLLVGLLLASVSIVLIDRNRRFLVGEAVDPRMREAALRELYACEAIIAVTYLHLEYSGPREIALVARVDLVADRPESEVAQAMTEIEERLEARRGISRVILAPARPDDDPLEVGRV